MRSMTCLATTWQEGWSGDIDKTVDNFIRKRQAGYRPTLLNGLPTDVTNHVHHTWLSAVVSTNKASCLSLYLLKWQDVTLLVRIPNRATVLKLRSHQGLIVLLPSSCNLWFLCDKVDCKNPLEHVFRVCLRLSCVLSFLCSLGGGFGGKQTRDCFHTSVVAVAASK